MSSISTHDCLETSASRTAGHLPSWLFSQSGLCLNIIAELIECDCDDNLTFDLEYLKEIENKINIDNRFLNSMEIVLVLKYIYISDIFHIKNNMITLTIFHFVFGIKYKYVWILNQNYQPTIMQF